MVSRVFIASLMFSILCFGQALPDRDELARKFVDKSTSLEAAQELVKHFQMGGMRTMIRNLNEMDYERILEFGATLRHVNLARFANDINNNLKKADGPQTKAFYLMLLSTVGQQLAGSNFEPFAVDETLPIYVRLAAASGLVKRQNPAIYDRFHALADQAVVDTTLGKDDLRFADIDKSNMGFFLYTKGKLSGEEITHGQIITALAMAEAKDTVIYEDILANVPKRKQREYWDMMIDRAVRVGGVALLDIMAADKKTKKIRGKIEAARPYAETMAKYRDQLIDMNGADLAVGPILPEFGTGTGSAPGYHSGFAIAKVSASGDISIVEHISPFGGNDNLKDMLKGKTFPAYNKSWDPVETLLLVVAP